MEKPYSFIKYYRLCDGKAIYSWNIILATQQKWIYDYSERCECPIQKNSVLRSPYQEQTQLHLIIWWLWFYSELHNSSNSIRQVREL